MNPNKKLPKAWGSADLIQKVFADTLANWEKNGVDTLERLRKEKPSDYLSFVAKVMGRAVELEGKLSDADRPTALTVTWVSPAPLQLPQAIEAEWQALPMEVKERVIKDNEQNDERDDDVIILSPTDNTENNLSPVEPSLVLPDDKEAVKIAFNSTHHLLHLQAEARYKLMPEKKANRARKQAERARDYYRKNKELIKQKIMAKKGGVLSEQDAIKEGETSANNG